MTSNEGTKPETIEGGLPDLAEGGQSDTKPETIEGGLPDAIEGGLPN
jgi:hypothetical protein